MEIFWLIEREEKLVKLKDFASLVFSVAYLKMSEYDLG